MTYLSVNEGNRLARSMVKALRTKHPSISLADALEALAAAQGYTDWNAFSKKETPAAIDALLKPFERQHAFDSQDADQRAVETDCGGYGPEAVARVHNGFQLRSPAYPEECTYVRVCDPLGREISYWSADEWKDAPEEVMGAVMGALVRGTSWRASKAPSPAKVPHISDVNFDQVGEVIWGENCFNLAWRHHSQENLVELLRQTDEDTADLDALTLSRSKEGFYEQEILSIGQLRSLVWSREQRCFLTEEAEMFRVFYTVDMADILTS